MANITVDYQSIPGKANEIISKGEELNSKFTTAYQSVDDLRNTWHGVRYNELISYFNQIVNSVNDVLDVVINQIPTALGTVAKNYAAADNSSCATVTAGTVTKVMELTESDTATMSFDSSTATSTKENVSLRFSEAQGLMDDIKTLFNNIEWESEAKDEFANKMQDLKSKIDSAIETINSQFTNLMQQSQADMEKAESANTVE